MNFVQVVVTDEQALLARAIIDIALADPETFVMTDEERLNYERLAVFLGEVVANPHGFPVTGAMATKVKRITRRAKSPTGEPLRNDGTPRGERAPKLNKRKARQESRQGFAKRRRKEQKEEAARFNEVRAIVEAEQEELRQIQEETIRALESEPRFDVIGPDGQLLLAGVPQSFIRPELTPEDDFEPDGEAVLPSDTSTAKILLPGKVEKAMEREAA